MTADSVLHHLCAWVRAGACSGGGGPKGPGLPQKLKSQKKKKEKGQQSKFYAISPIFCYFFSRK